MCGICGTTASADDALLRAMCAKIRHRGPDAEGVYVDRASGAGLGATRLSIIDLEHGDQPIANEDETVWAVLNGEIYNYRALRERLAAAGHVLSTASDTEVLVHLYEEHGVDLADQLEGMFVFAIWDARHRRLVIGRDRFGEKPLYYAERDGRLSFASELTALAVAVPSLRLDPATIDSYFCFGYVPGRKAAVDGVLRLEPAHLLVWSDGQSELRRYWSLPRQGLNDVPAFPELVEEAERLLRASVVSRLHADVPVGVFLSGGVDSTLVTALAARESAGVLKSFSVAYDVGSVGEADAARRAAKAVGTEHHELLLTEAMVEERARPLFGRLDEPLADPSLIALHELARMARGRVKVAVGGEGADELFGGYPRYSWIARGARVRSGLPAVARRAADAAASALEDRGRSSAAHVAQMVSSPSLAGRHVAWVTAGRLLRRHALYGPRLTRFAGVGGEEALAVRIPSGASTVARAAMDIDRRYWLPDDVLAKADRSTMLASLEMRTPYLNRELAEFAARIPPSVHLSRGGKALLRATLARAVPGRDYRRRKLAFRVPLAEWLRGPLAGELREQLVANALYADGWFSASAVEQILREHESGARDWSPVLWPIFVLGAWMDGAGKAFA